MRRTILLVLQLVFATSLTQALAAQDAILHKGTRIRFTEPSYSRKPIVGVVDTVSQGIVTVRPNGAPYSATFPLAQMSRLDISRGRRRPTWSKTAPLWLTLATGGIGAAIGSGDKFFGPMGGAVILGGITGTLGLLVGTVIAAEVQRDTWEPVSLAARSARAPVTPSMFVRPDSKGLSVGMRAAF